MEMILMLIILFAIMGIAYVGLWIIAIVWRLIDKKSFLKAYRRYEMWGEE